VPRTKQIGYYSDMYKLEFALPKFNMYKRILAKVLAERFVSIAAGARSRRRRRCCGNVASAARRAPASVEKRYFIDPLSASVSEAPEQVLAPVDEIRIEPPQDDDDGLVAESEPAASPVLDRFASMDRKRMRLPPTNRKRRKPSPRGGTF
jgi:hypothetical protein